MPHATLPSPGLQALILCGPGISLNTFTSNPTDFPKALIPIANRPMVWYPLDWCHRMGITNITLITPAESAAPLETALATHPALTSLPSPKAEILAPAELAQTTGTGELLRLPQVQDCITSDFVVLPCDLISELDGTKLLQQWLTLNPPQDSSRRPSRRGGLGAFYPTYGLEGISNKKDETDFIATVPLPTPAVPPSFGSLRPNIEELVLSMPTDTLNDKLEADKGFLRLRQSLLNKHGRVKMKLKHRDAHVYFFPKWVKDFAARNDRFDSISEDVLGWWAKARWQDGLAEKLGLHEVLGEGIRALEDSQAALDVDEIDPSALSSTKSLQPARPVAHFASRVSGANSPALPSFTIPPLLAYTQPSTSATSPQPLLRRIDTTAQLLSVSLHLARQAAPHPLSHEHKVHPSATIGMQSRISQEDSLVGENVKLGIRCNVKESIVGANCEIGNNVRLVRSLLMDGAVVGHGVQLTGCIVGRRARIEGLKPSESAPIVAPAEGAPSEGPETKPREKGKQRAAAGDDDDGRTTLTDCEVAPNFVVEAGTEAKGEKLMAFDTEADMDDSDEARDETEDGEA